MNAEMTKEVAEPLISEGAEPTASVALLHTLVPYVLVPRTKLPVKLALKEGEWKMISMDQDQIIVAKGWKSYPR